MPVLVVGATGILGPVVATLVAAGETVVALARSSDRLALLAANNPLIEPMAVDATDARALVRAVGERSFDAAIAYAPAVGPDSLWFLRTAVTGRLVVVLTSATADNGTDDFNVEDLGRPTCGERRLLLGWAGTGPSARWHTPHEVSEAALEVLADGRERILGTVRPWADRPR